ncbi:hypothetical protein C8J56DRAFT_1010544 [Mycena floridula]|nr:hypothetical protein C8J56DRAFT_1010544 [Mycena floridula]
MPLDTHSYLVAQGWTGKGKGLREGAITRPIAVSQKKTLAGLGKDRDEAFPFWDHLFAAAAKSIQIKISDDSDNTEPEGSVLKRTTTGILSNRRPAVGTPATSGSSTPDSTGPQLSLLCIAKREAAKRGLYSNFLRGPVLGPDLGFETPTPKAAITAEVSNTKGKRKAVELKEEEEEGEEAKRERKRAKKERKLEKEQRRVEKKAAKEEKRAKKALKAEEKAERKRRKKEKREDLGDDDEKDATAHSADKKRKRKSSE